MVFRDVAMQHTDWNEGHREVWGWWSIYNGSPSRRWAINNGARGERLATGGQRRRWCIQGHALRNRRAIRKHSICHISWRRHKWLVLLAIQFTIFLAVFSTVSILKEIKGRCFLPYCTQ